MSIQLFHRWPCPYSDRVRTFIDDKGLREHLDFVEVSEVPGAEERLESLTGKTQVPCLVVDGKPILESEDIMRWMEENLVRR